MQASVVVKPLIYIVPDGVKFAPRHSTFAIIGKYGCVLMLDKSFVVFIKRGRLIVCSANVCYAVAKLVSAIKGALYGHIRWVRLNGIGYKVLARACSLELSLGLSHKLIFKLPQNVESAVFKNNKLKLKSVNLESVTATASALRAKKIPDAYRAKGIVARRIRNLKT
ncbi:MAG: hypothetical protein AAJB65_00655 [Candidatus Hodgkinia cicadicola]